MSPTTKQLPPPAQPQGLLPESIEEQYKDGRYSDFVESNQNQEFYTNYLHYSFFQALQQEEEEEAATKPLSKVLDLGCGNGILSRKIWRKQQQQQNQQPLTIVAMDKMNSMLNRGREVCLKEGIPLLDDDNGGSSGGILFRQVDLLVDAATTTTDDNNNSLLSTNFNEFDVTMSGFLLAHLTTQNEIETVLRFAYDALKPDGLSLHIIPGTPPTDAATQQQEGQAFRVELPLPNNNKPIVLYDVHWNESTYVNSMKRIGFVEVSIEKLQFHPNTTQQWKQQNGFPSGYKLLKGKKKESR